ncbi:MAG: TonB-dependent receptor [Bryobacterales bacterium]|nr:TonB-dependent receptor [Bryobacterales bacterium]
MNGASWLQNQFVMDGMDNNNYHYGIVIASNQTIKPSVDAIQEFKVETHNASAEFGRGGGGVVQVTTKSGTNEFHGTAFEFLRNDKLDANNFFNSGRTKPPYRQNQYGGTFGGPIIKDRTFFFASYQGTRIREKLTTLSTVPTPAMLSGDFGATVIYDPATQAADGTRQAFAGNRIPTARIDPVSIRVLQLYPQPNRAGVQNYLYNPSRNDNDEQVDTRFDHRFRERDTIFLRYSWHDRDRLEPGNLPEPANGGATAVRLAKAHSAVFSHTHVFASASMVNELRAAYSRNDGNIDTPTREKLYLDFGFKGLFERGDITGLPFFSPGGYVNIGDRSFAPDPKIVDLKQLVENLSITRGRHSMKTGANIRNFRRYAGTTDFARGRFLFNGQFTASRAGGGANNSIADAMLGLTNNAQLSTPLDHTLMSTAWELYFQDNFKLSGKLTLELGVRYEYMPPFHERRDRFATFVFDSRLPSAGTIVLADPEGSHETRSFQRPDRNNWAPRIGLAWQATPTTVVRSAYGLFYDNTVPVNFDQLSVMNPPFYLRTDIPTGNQNATSNLIVRNGFAANALQPNVLAGRALFSAWPYEFPDGLTHQWNINIQKSLPGNSVLSAAYVGTNSVHRRSGPVDINQPIPGSGDLNSRRAYSTVAGITTSVPEGRGNYQGLELRFERRFSRGFSTLNGYTRSKTMQMDMNQNTRRLGREKGLSTEHIPNRFFSTVIYELPFGKGRKWLDSGVLALIAGGWQVSSLVTAQNGMQLTPTMTANPANTTGATRPDRLRDGNLPRGERTPDRWFDRTAFALPAAFTFGNAGVNIIEGPGLINFDGALARVFPINERVRIDFRAEFFNFLNEAQFGFPNMTVNTAPAGAISATDRPARQLQFGLKLVF